MLRKHAGPTWLSMVALALGIGGVTFTFISVQAMLLHPLPYPALDRLVRVSETLPGGERSPMSPAVFEEWQAGTQTFASLAALRDLGLNLTGNGEPERINGYAVSAEFFDVLGMRPIRGRTFTAEECIPGRERVVMLSERFWQRRYASDPQITGKSISLDGKAYTVAGVMPDEFDFPLGADLWAPLAFTPEERQDRQTRSLAVFGRLKAGVPIEQARSEAAILAQRLEREYPDTQRGRGGNLWTLRALTNEVTDKFVAILFAAAVFVLLLACANVANLQIAQGSTRRKEIAVRLALGASRWQIARQFVTENLLIALAGGLGAILLAAWCMDLQRSSIPAEVYRWVAGIRHLHIDGRTALFAAAISALAGLLCGLLPAWQLLHIDSPDAELKEAGRASSSGRRGTSLRDVLVVAEVALALVLLVGAGLMVQTFRHLMVFDAGYNPHNLLTLRVDLTLLRYRDLSQISAYREEALRRMHEPAGVVAAATETEQGAASRFYVDGRPELKPGEPRPNLTVVSPEYFRAVGIPLIAGRAFADSDSRDSAPVAILSERIARYYFPGRDAVGAQIRLDGPESRTVRVVGVSGDVKEWFTHEVMPRLYVPATQHSARDLHFLVRTAGDPLALAGTLRTRLAGVDASEVVYAVKSMDQAVVEQTSGVQGAAQTMSAFALIALLLAVSGIFGVISYVVTRQTREIGIRMAMGAQPGDVLRMVLARAVRLGLTGACIGLPVGVGLMAAASAQVYGVFTLDALLILGLTVLLLAAALLAGWIPARRAARVDPITALHHD